MNHVPPFSPFRPCLHRALPQPIPSSDTRPSAQAGPATKNVAPQRDTSPRDVWYPRPFTRALALLGAHDAAREAALQAWSILLKPPASHAHIAPASMTVREMGRCLQAALRDSSHWTQTRAYIGGSTVWWVQGSTEQVHKPHDVDVALFVTRRANASIDVLRGEVVSALREIYRVQLGLDAQASTALRFHAPILASHDGKDSILSVRLGTAEQHIDVRFVFTDSRFRLYDYVCNALCCSLYDSGTWSVMPGADVQQVFADMHSGIYRIDHTLTDGSIVRAWKMNRRGLVPADLRQERALWDQLIDAITTGGADDNKGPGLRLAELLARETDTRRHGAATPMRKAALALFVNARLSLAAVGMRAHQTMVDTQLEQRIVSLVAQLNLSQPTRDVLAMLGEAGGAQRLAQWCSLFARTSDTLVWPRLSHDVVIEYAGERAAAQMRLFVPELDAFVILRVPPRPVAYRAQPAQAPLLPPAPQSDVRAVLAQACGDMRLASWAPPLHGQDSDRAYAAAQNLIAQVDALAPKEAKAQARMVLASLALSAKAPLSTSHIDAVRLSMGPYQADQALQAHLCYQIETACHMLTHEGEAHVRTSETDAVRTRAWTTLLHAAPRQRRNDARAAYAAHQHAYQSAAARIMTALAHAPHRRALDMPYVATLISQAAMPSAADAPDALATWLLWRAHVSAGAVCGIEALRAPLRPALRLARRAVAQGHTTFLSNLLSAMLTKPEGMALCLHLDALVPCPASCMPTAVAQRILASLPAHGGHPHHLTAAQTALAALTHKRAALLHSARQGAWLKRMLASAPTRLAVFEALAATQCVLDAKLATTLMPPLLVFDALKHTAAQLLTGTDAREAFTLVAAAHLWASPDQAILITRWRHIYLLLNTAQAVSGPEAAALAKRFVAHYGCIALPETPPDEPLTVLEAAITTGLAASSHTSDPALGLGHARLMLSSRDCITLALPCLHKHASAALGDPTLGPAFVHCMLALTAEMTPDDAQSEAICLSLAQCVTQVPHIAPGVGALAAEMAVRLIELCSAAHAPELSGRMLVHAHEQWRLPHVGALINHRVNRAGDDARTRAWMMTLVANVGPDEMRAGICLPLLDARLEAMLALYTMLSPSGHGGVFQSCLQVLSPSLRVREKALAGHPLDRVNQLLVLFFRQAPDQAALQRWVFSEPQSRHTHAPLWASIWTSWCTAGKDSAQARIRARLVLEHLRVDLSACTADVAPAPEALDIAVALVTLATADVGDGQLCLERWAQLLALCCIHTPKLWWLETLCQASARHRTRLLGLVVDALTQRLLQARAKQTDGASPDADRQMALTLLYMVAHRADELSETTLIKAAQAALDAAGPHLVQDPSSWHALVTRIQTFAPTLGARLDPYLERINQAQASARNSLARHHVSLNALRAENMSAWLRTTTPEKFVYAFEALAAMEEGWSWQPDTRVYSWRTAVGAMIRRPTGLEAIKTYLTETVITPDNHAQPAWALLCLFDALWDTGTLDAELVGLLLKQMVRSQRQPQTHGPLTRLTRQLTCSVQHFNLHLRAETVQVAQQWVRAVRHHPSLHQAAHNLLEAVRTSLENPNANV